MMTEAEFHIRARGAEKSADLAKMLRDLSSHNGPIVQVARAFIEARDMIADASLNLSLDSPADVMKAVDMRGQAKGILTCLSLIYRLMSEETQDGPV